MNSIAFPKMFSRVKSNTVNDYDATLQNLKLLILSEKGELFGDPYYGTGLKKYLFDQNDTILQDILLDDIYTAVSLFIPQLKIERSGITFSKKENGELTVNIKAINRADFSTDMYNIILVNAEQ